MTFQGSHFCRFNNRLVVNGALLLFCLGAYLAAKAHDEVQAPNPVTPGAVKLDLKLANGQIQFHRGELIPIELTFTSAESRTYTLYEACRPHIDYQYHAPPEFVDRVIEEDAALTMDLGMGCHGGQVPIDLSTKPLGVKQFLNQRFRMDMPGKYQFSVTSVLLGFPVTSNTVDVEILPSDRTWEETELHRATSLITTAKVRGGPGWEDGCRMLRYLDTEAAEVEMARHEGGPTRCDFGSALISAVNRKPVIAELEKGLADPDLDISWDYLRTVSLLSLYDQHPDWYPTSATSQSVGEPTQTSGLWRQRGAPEAEEIRYARVLVASLSMKAPQARALSLETLIYMGQNLGNVEVPEDLYLAMLRQMPATFSNLQVYARVFALVNEWDEFKAQAMEPVLDDAVERVGWLGPDGIALRRLNEISPVAAQPVILRMLRAPAPERYMERLPTYGSAGGIIETLSMLPEKELPELDDIMLTRLQSAPNNFALEISAGLLQRYSSSAIADQLRPWFEERIGKLPCAVEANLLAYFMRIDPKGGADTLLKVMHANVSGCLLLQSIARVRMSPEVEQAALSVLDDPQPTTVQDALGVLQGYGSLAAKEPILEHFRMWHAIWASRVSELVTPAGKDQAGIERAYNYALGDAQAWVTSAQDLQLIEGLCVTAACKVEAAQIQNPWGLPPSTYMIQILDPWLTQGRSDEFEYFVEPGNPGPRTVERLKQKMTQFPRGSIFLVDARNREKHVTRHFFTDLQPWATSNGFKIQLMLN